MTNHLHENPLVQPAFSAPAGGTARSRPIGTTPAVRVRREVEAAVPAHIRLRRVAAPVIQTALALASVVPTRRRTALRPAPAGVVWARRLVARRVGGHEREVRAFLDVRSAVVGVRQPGVLYAGGCALAAQAVGTGVDFGGPDRGAAAIHSAP